MRLPDKSRRLTGNPALSVIMPLFQGQTVKNQSGYWYTRRGEKTPTTTTGFLWLATQITAHRAQHSCLCCRATYTTVNAMWLPSCSSHPDLAPFWADWALQAVWVSAAIWNMCWWADACLNTYSAFILHKRILTHQMSLWEPRGCLITYSLKLHTMAPLLIISNMCHWLLPVFELI